MLATRIEKNDPQGRSIFLIACYAGNLALVKILLESNRANLDEVDNEGSNAFILCGKRGHIELYKYLRSFDNDQHYKARDKFGYTAMGWAVIHEQRAMVKELLQTGLIDYADEYTPLTQDTLLLFAVRCGYIEITWDLLELGAKLTERNRLQEEHATTLDYAAKHGNLSFLQQLIQKAAEKHKDWLSQRAPYLIFSAAKGGQLKMVQWLSATYPGCLNRVDTQGLSVLHCAIWPDNCEDIKKGKNYLALVTFLLTETTINPISKNQYDETPLYIAVEKGCLEIAKLIYQKLNEDERKACMRCRQGTLAHAAAKSGNIDMIDWVFENFPLTVEEKNLSHETPLFVAVRSGQLKMVIYLIEARKAYRYEQQLSTGASILHVAAGEGFFVICQYLVSVGMNIHAADNVDKFVLGYALQSDNDQLIDWLWSISKITKDTLLLSALLHGTVLEVKNILQRLVSVSDIDRDRRIYVFDGAMNFVQIAVIVDSLEAVKFLTQDNDKLYQDGHNLLQLALQYRSYQVVTYLLSEEYVGIKKNLHSYHYQDILALGISPLVLINLRVYDKPVTHDGYHTNSEKVIISFSDLCAALIKHPEKFNLIKLYKAAKNYIELEPRDEAGAIEFLRTLEKYVTLISLKWKCLFFLACNPHLIQEQLLLPELLEKLEEIEPGCLSAALSSQLTSQQERAAQQSFYLLKENHSLFSKSYKNYLIDNRFKDAEIGETYDKNYALIVRPS